MPTADLAAVVAVMAVATQLAVAAAAVIVAVAAALKHRDLYLTAVVAVAPTTLVRANQIVWGMQAMVSL
jgi:hypothetical protein